MKILMVSPFFAPYSLVGANRMMSLSRFLTEKGHDVTVWAHDRATLARFSDKTSLCSNVPDKVNTIRFSVPAESANKYLFAISYDKQIRACRRAAKKQLNKNNYDVIIMSCGPTYQQEAVLRFAKKENIPLVMDMRDLDVLSKDSGKHNCFIKALKNLFWKYRKYRPEKLCMEYAKKVVVVVPGADTDVEKAYGISKDKTTVIYNGYDEKSLEDLPKEEKDSGILRIGFFGKLMCYSPERGEMLLAALDGLSKSGVSIELYHVGPKCPKAYETINDLGLCPQIYNFEGPKDYREGMALMQNADMFAIEYLDPKGLGTKIFDYIFLNKPIICVSPKECVLARTVSSFENGFSCDSEVEIAEAIKTIVEERRTVLDNMADLSVYSRTKQNERYEKLLMEISKNALMLC